jgi:hypothetical protein
MCKAKLLFIISLSFGIVSLVMWVLYLFKFVSVEVPIILNVCQFASIFIQFLFYKFKW